MSLTGIMDALAGQIEDTLGGTSSPVIQDLQVEGRLMWNPTPPAVDVYPSEELFQEAIAFGSVPGKVLSLTVRARVNTADREGAQDTLLNMMDSEAAESVEAAILSDRTLGGTVDDTEVEGPSNFGVFVDPGGVSLLGCTWRVLVLP